MNLNRVVDLVGVALVLGLVLRYSKEFAIVVGSGGAAITSFYNAVALQGTRGSPVE